MAAIYLDHAATTKPDEAVIAAMVQAMRDAPANPSALYAASGEGRRLLRRARQAVAELTGAQADEVLFTSGGTEADNWAVKLAAGRHAVISAVEHHAVLNAAKLWGCEVSLVPPDVCGRITARAVAERLRADTALIAVQLANNETGVIHEIPEIGALARAKRVPFLCDAVQGVGRVPVDVRASSIDLLALSGHKLYGPRGVGALVVRTGVPLPPLIAGGGQESGLRGGTENVPAIAGLAVAATLAKADMAEEAARERGLIDHLLAQLRQAIPEMTLLSEGAPRLPGLAALLLPGLDASRAIAELDLRGVMVSGGAACAARSGEVSHVYRAMGLSDADARCVLRVSVGRDNTPMDMDAAAAAMIEIYKNHRRK